MATSQKHKPNKLKKQRFYKRKRFWLLLAGFALVAASCGYLAAERYTRPYRERAMTYDLERINELEIPSLILDRNGKEIGRVFVQNRSVIPITEVPEIFKDALRAGEDQRFNSHDGVDYIGVIRAVWLNYRAGETTQGASTITQQLARNAYDLESERRKLGEEGIQRKMVEAFLAQRIEKRYQKEQILEFYLNRIYFGSGYYGIRSAALGYFGKEPKELDALESAAIVGCIKNPSNLSPINNPAGNKTSRNLVLGRMVDLGALTRLQASQLVNRTLKLDPRPLKRGTTHLYERVADEIRREMGEDALAEGGFRIHTSIDAEVQRSMESSLQRSFERAEQQPGYANPRLAEYRKSSNAAPEYLQGAGLMIDHGNGEVIAHVGGRDYADAPYDVIELGRRPLGTAFLPFLFAVGLEQGLTPATILEDEPMDNRSVMIGGRQGIVPEWGMEVPRPLYEGKITVRRALESSKIGASVHLAGMAGLANVIQGAERFGLPMKDAELLPRLAAGWEAASLKDAVGGIAAFARGGQTGPRRLTYVNKVEDAEGRPRYRRDLSLQPVRLSATDEATAFMVHSMMRGSMDQGSAAGLADRMVEKPFTGAGKTGTTHDFSDNWFLGYNGRVACGVWIGFLQPGKTIYGGAFSRDLAMPVWEETMNAAAPAFGGKGIAQPESVVEGQVCRVTGQRATPYCYETVADPSTGRPRTRPASQLEFFRKGTENLPFCSLHSGAAAGGNDGSAAMGLGALAVIDTTPVRPKAPVLLGEDPYFTEQILMDGDQPATTRNRANVLDSFDLGDGEEPLKLPWPERLEIFPE